MRTLANAARNSDENKLGLAMLLLPLRVVV